MHHVNKTNKTKMNKTKKVVLLTIVFAIVFTLAAHAQAQSQIAGCCCDAIGETGSFKPQNQCPSPLLFSTNFQTTADLARCICTQQTTPGTSTAPAQDCSNPALRAPLTLSAKPIKGELGVRLEFTLDCPTDSINISRCDGAGCTNFKQIAILLPQLFYEDKSPELKWAQTYTYKLIAKSNSFGDSLPATKTIELGDLECNYQYTNNQFCLDSNYYSKYDMYLKEKGYLTKSAQDFKTNFDAAVLSLFNGRFKKAFRCDDNNKLSSPTLNCAASQSLDQVCVSTGTSVACADTTIDCKQANNIFGLFSTPTECEGTTQKKYCFFDKSFSIVDVCYKCNSQMNCYDYKSKDACARNNCGVGQCSWKPMFEDIGVGVCIDERFNNCQYCAQKGTPNAPNLLAFNEIFDQCSQEKTKALSTNINPCFFAQSPVAPQALSCDLITCKDYTKAQCAADLSKGVTLNLDNSIATPSQDQCGIKTCQWSQELQCVKNADATPTTAAHWQDCDDLKCEKDYFSPKTTMFPVGAQGRADFLQIKILDKINKTSLPTQKQGTANYTTYVCANIASGTPCMNFVPTNSIELNVNDETLKLQDGVTPIADLVEGYNRIRFYSKDANKNLEVIKPLPAGTSTNQTALNSDSTEIIIKICKNCSGPKIIGFNVSHSRVWQGVYYTSDIQPVIHVIFNKESEIITFTLNNTNLVPIIKTPQGKSTQFVITTTSAQQQPLQEGAYTFTLNAQDNSARLMDAPLIKQIVVKTSQTKVQILPSDKSVLNTNSALIKINFSEQASIKNVTVQEEILTEDYVKKINQIEITDKLTTSDNKTYSYTLTGLNEGQKNIVVSAEDLTGAGILATSIFYVNTLPAKIILTKPRFGVAPDYVFNITVETTISKGLGTTPAINCKWVYGEPVAPPSKDFATFANFNNEYDNKHEIYNFNRISSDELGDKNFYVYCKDNKSAIVQKTFNLSIDLVKPNILYAFAEPNPIAEELFPDSKQYLTTIKVQTDKPTFCKYSSQAVDFESMENQFFGYGEKPATVNLADVIVTQPKDYSYFVQCQSIAGLLSAPKQVNFGVNTNVEFKVNNTTPKLWNSTNVLLSLKSNKRARCYYNNQPQQVTNCMGECNFTTTHTQQITAPSQGNMTYYVQCSRGSTAETSQIIPIKIFIDTTAPKMIYVNDTSSLPDEPEISPYKDKLLTAFLGTDDETEVTQYRVAVENTRTKNLTLNWVLSTHTDGKTFFIPEAGTMNLLDNETYIIRVKPINIVGLAGEEQASNGVTTDFSKLPPGKFDGETCKKDVDCISNFCTNSRCAQASCTDDVKNGLETDIDCGANCQKCDKDKKCKVTRDCTSGLACSFGKCQDLGPCFDAILSDTETDIDCGGACLQKCAENKKCRETKDCAFDLSCTKNVCTKTIEVDSDQDGVVDSKDKCQNTQGKADLDGCSDSQKFSVGDEIPDSWRMQYFSCIDCPEAAAEADPDSDGLTNVEEFKMVTNPTDSLSPLQKKTSILSIILWILLILLLIGAAGLGGYSLYQYYLSTKEQKQPVRVISVRPPQNRQFSSQEMPEFKPEQKMPWLSDKIDALRKYILPKEQTDNHEWLTVPQLHKATQLNKKEEIVKKEEPKQIFKKLKEFSSEQNLTPHQNTEITQKKAGATGKIFEKLRVEALEQSLDLLSEKEKKELMLKIKLMKQNKLGKEELEKLLKKLRLTAQYYKTNKEKLHQEMGQWLKRK